MKGKCDLCKGPELKTEKEHQDYWISYCRSCKVLMAWSREHIMPLDPHSRAIHDLMLEGLKEVADRIYSKGNYILDFKQRTIGDHMHIHAR